MKALRIDAAIIRAARLYIGRLPPNIAPIPAVVPSAAGNLQFQWSTGRRSLELEIENPSTIHYFKWDPNEEVEEEDIFSIEDTDRTVRLIQWFVDDCAWSCLRGQWYVRQCQLLDIGPVPARQPAEQQATFLAKRICLAPDSCGDDLQSRDIRLASRIPHRAN